MNPKDNFYSHAIVRRPCSHCGELCSPLAKICPKCGEPFIQTLPRLNKESIDQIIAAKSCAFQTIVNLEKIIKKPIPKLEKLERNVVGYISDSEYLTGISLFKCGLVTIPRELTDLTNLKYLYLRRNSINTIPNSMGFLNSLEELDLSINEISTLPNSIGLLKNLKKLVLSSNKLTDVPDTIGTMSNLEILNLSNNRLKCVPLTLNKLIYLKELDLKANFWIVLPEAILKLKENGLKIDI